ncbi:MAG TPA: hypothetical protein VFH58_16415 [Acidimicrobiales bacterium]|nr:hypothetical protein [Acidimicrobiales bacterium]
MVLDDSGRARSAYAPRHRAASTGRGTSTARRGGDAAVESNSRLTGAAAAVLLVLFFLEGITILGVRQHLNWHVFIGMLLIPPVLVKIGSTTWRFVRYYRGSPAYVRKGPPPLLLRLLGPALVVLTVVMLASGVVLVLAPHAGGDRMLFVHKASFVLWFGAMAIHVLGHLTETAKLAPLDLARRTRSQIAGASARQWALVVSLALGVVLGIVMLGPSAHYLTHSAFLHHDH